MPPERGRGFIWQDIGDFPVGNWKMKRHRNKIISKKNLLFYQRNAAGYSERTIHLDVDKIREEFIRLLPEGGHILDIGCGSGRDSRVFLDHGFIVTPTDASAEMAALAGKFLGRKVRVQRAQELDDKEKYDAIWASASLLHIPKSEIDDTFRAIGAALKTRGIWYMSFKKGTEERWDDHGRFFNDYSIRTLTRLLNKIEWVEIVDIYEKTAPGSYGDECWLNIFLKKTRTGREKNFTG